VPGEQDSKKCRCDREA